MHHGIETVTVIGAGTMGAAIAGHLANAGLAVHLLDIAPDTLLPEEAGAGLTLDSPQVRNRIVRTGFERMAAARPANLFAQSVADRIRLGNLEDDFERAVSEADWVLEAIVERPGPKQALMARIEACAKPDAVISTNTSGIPISRDRGGSNACLRTPLPGHALLQSAALSAPAGADSDGADRRRRGAAHGRLPGERAGQRRRASARTRRTSSPTACWRLCRRPAGLRRRQRLHCRGSRRVDGPAAGAAAHGDLPAERRRGHGHHGARHRKPVPSHPA